MKIENMRFGAEKEFYTLKYGQAFYYSGHFYMRMNGSQNAICLSSGNAEDFASCCRITPVNAKVVIE